MSKDELDQLIQQDLSFRVVADLTDKHMEALTFDALRNGVRNHESNVNDLVYAGYQQLEIGKNSFPEAKAEEYADRPASSIMRMASDDGSSSSHQ